MGLDKEATDIWVFGRPRPDLSLQETVAEAATAAGSGALLALGPEERARREKLVADIVARRTRDMALGVEIGMRAAKANLAKDQEKE